MDIGDKYGQKYGFYIIFSRLDHQNCLIFGIKFKPGKILESPIISVNPLKNGSDISKNHFMMLNSKFI